MNEIKIERFTPEDFNSIANLHLNSFKSSSFHNALFKEVKDSDFKQHLIQNNLVSYSQDKTNIKIGLKAIKNDNLLGYCLMEERSDEINVVTALKNRNYPDGFNFEFANNLMEQEPFISEHHYRLRILAVDPSVQSTGVGTALIQHCIKLADSKKLNIYIAATDEASSFYSQHSFVPYGLPCTHESIKTTILIRLSQPLQPLLLSPASPSDSTRFAQIHRFAFSPFKFHRTIYGACSAKDLDITFGNRFKSLIDQPDKYKILKATRGNFILGFAFWELPISPSPHSLPSVPTERTHPPGINLAIALPWFTKVDQHTLNLQQPNYHLHIISTEPSFQFTGVARLLIEWGFKLADSEERRIYLDATSEGIRVYEKLGFVGIEGEEGKPIVAGDGLFDVTPMVRFPVKNEFLL